MGWLWEIKRQKIRPKIEFVEVVYCSVLYYYVLRPLVCAIRCHIAENISLGLSLQTHRVPTMIGSIHLSAAKKKIM